jgi:hypothetical protein
MNQVSVDGDGGDGLMGIEEQQLYMDLTDFQHKFVDTSKTYKLKA